MPKSKFMAALAVFFLVASLEGFAGGGPERSSRALAAGAALGSLMGSGPILVDNQPAPVGTTLFAGDVIATGESAKAMMDLRSGTIATFNTNTEVALSSDGSLTALDLRHGAVVVRTNGSQPARVSVLGATVTIEGEGGFPAICSVASVGRSGVVIAERGRAEIHGAGAPVILSAGKYAKLEAGQATAAAGQQAGKVATEIPAETVQRQGKGAEISLSMNDAVNWTDLIKTLKRGRVRIAMLDGSFLNIGAGSVMRIVRHDPASQQTSIEMTLGRLRGEVVKLSKPGANFQVQTQTAVIGVVGTVFMVHAFPNTTRVYSLDGLVTVRNVNPAIVGQVTLHAGQFTAVPRGLPPVGVATAPPGQIHTEMAHTNLPGVQPPPSVMNVSGATQATTSGVTTTTTTAVNAASTASSATGTGLTAATVTTVGSATTMLTQANATLTQAATSANAAAAAASTAVSTTSNVNTGVQTIVAAVSPSTTGCGCQ